MIVKNPSKQRFDEIVAHGKTIVDFWASWCGPCRAQAPIVEKLESDTDVDLIKIDVDEEQTLTSMFGISSIPTLVLYEDGKIIKQYIGLTSLDELERAFGG